MSGLKHFICWLKGHDFLMFDSFTKRRCERCAREEWAMGNPHPRIGEPAYYWKHMPFGGQDHP